ncbi:aminomethyl-transferring glycine dehydrogenase subunit GcvPA [Dehalobacterium formicoaceticum]|uniref:Probable glycine dehydrogenase (decarboxylating) subunit 1 n=1 Tax=Dehalobacterium formicoaceticum TaxID=51515 RepID=A0ABT1Y1I5_9FIRM|nr:aminomethyl-transferring glycine dehydrogenase subunit GcvPA [Dehalobacterium formicoaceticum]MCR6544730.1 aminomethyl-transferring glycine dehydrogenase subunit GcvPA [Dehalobacterium formicoaceticum]
MSRYISNTPQQQLGMLNDLGLNSTEDLFQDIPQEVRLKRALNLPSALSEMELVKLMAGKAGKNFNLDDYSCFLGAGAYDHFVPSVIDHILSRQEFYTAYTPYQPEISQGTLQSIFEYQTMICELTGMDVANASMYDGASALAEAGIMACQAVKRSEILVAKTVHPESRVVLNTYAKFRDIKVVEIGYDNGQIDLKDLAEKISPDTAAVVVQSPNFFGIIESLQQISDLAHQNKSLFIVSADPISLALLKSPGELGADIVVGEGQPLGNAISFGGPYLGFFAAKDKLMRKMPGRIVGETKDTFGNRGFVLTIQTREQHIRREKATSNICSNQALNALAATIYLTLLGKEGLKEVAELCLNKAHYAFNQLVATGNFQPLFNAPFFKEFALKSLTPVEQLNKKLLDEKIIGGYALGKDYPDLTDGWLIAVTEKRTKEEIDLLAGKAGGEIA